MKLYTLILSLALLCVSAGVHAAGGGGGGGDTTQADPVRQAANAAIAKKDWVAAQAALKQALASNAQNADYHNLYAYSLRKGANPDMKLVFFHYEEDCGLTPNTWVRMSTSVRPTCKLETLLKPRSTLPLLTNSASLDVRNFLT